MSVLITIFAWPTMIWEGNVLHGIIKKKKVSLLIWKIPNVFLHRGRQRVAFPMLGKTLHKLLYFSLLEGPILRKGGTESRDVPSTQCWIRPHRLDTFLCAAWSSVIHLFREITRNMAPVYYNMFWFFWLIYVILCEEKIDICI